MSLSYEFLFPSRLFITPPKDFIGFAAWFIYLFVIILLVKKLWQPLPKWTQKNWLFYYFLAIISPISIVLGGLQFNASIPGTSNLAAPVFLLFSSIPWLIAAGFYGMFPALIIGTISGISMAWWGTHNLFTIVEIMGMTILFSFLVRQKYRGSIFSLLRIPIIAAVFTGFIFIPILIINQIMNGSGSLAVRIDYGLSQTFVISLFRIAELIFGGAICSIFYFGKFTPWYAPKFLSPTPLEKKIEYRFLMTTVPVILLIVLFLIFVDWQVAGNAARDLVEARLKSAAEVTSESLPYFFESGQNLIVNMADKELLQPETDVWEELSNKIQVIPFFTQLYVFDGIGEAVDGYPIRDANQLQLSEEEKTGIGLALTGVRYQIYTSPPKVSDNSVIMTFITTIVDEEGNSSGVLIGRTDLVSNPYVQPAISALNIFSKSNGISLILDDQNRIVYHSSMEPQVLWSVFPKDASGNQNLFEYYATDGSSQLVYSQDVKGRSWSVLVGLPFTEVQELALLIAAPLLGVLALVIILVILALRLSLKPITKSVGLLTDQAAMISRGELDEPISINSVDELGQLAYSFDQMRIKLRDRLDELKQLLISSQNVSKHLDINSAIHPILKATMGEDSTNSRAVLIKQVADDQTKSAFVSLGIGQENEAIIALDKQLFEMMRYQEILPVPNLARFKRFTIPGNNIPGAILAIALHHENQYYGVVWLAYRSARTFKDEEIQYFKTLASQAAMAASNAKLYVAAELGRQRFEAVLNSTPDPVMVFDEENHLLLINPAAKQLAGLFKDTSLGNHVDNVIEHQELLRLLKKDTVNRDTSGEIQLTNKRVFFTTVSPVIRNDQMVGKVCLLRDITQYKEVDTFKSDIVSLVSHDLRSPLTQMRGYASMLQMVGEINDQQRSYVAKIISGVDSMSKLVHNLLDVGKIDAGVGIRFELTNPTRIAEQVVLDLQPQATQKNIELILENTIEHEITMEVDPDLLQEALYNVVENGLKYNTIGGSVKVVVEAMNGFVIYEITDNGIGIAPIDLPHLFEKFYRSGRREAYDQRGSGLGLAMVKSIIEKHNGKVWVESKLGRGSSFYLQIPLRQP